MKSLTKLALAGVSGLLLLKIAVALVAPVLGLAFGLAALVVKVAVVVSVAYFVMEWLKKTGGSDGSTLRSEGAGVEFE